MGSHTQTKAEDVLCKEWGRIVIVFLENNLYKVWLRESMVAVYSRDFRIDETSFTGREWNGSDDDSSNSNNEIGDISAHTPSNRNTSPRK